MRRHPRPNATPLATAAAGRISGPSAATRNPASWTTKLTALVG